MTFIIGILTSDIHPLKISVTEAVYHGSDSTLIVNSKIFIDDLEAALQEFTQNKSFRLSESSDSNSLREMISKYLSSRLELTTDRKINLKLMNIQFDDLVIWCEQRSSGISPFNKIEIKNTILIDTFEVQQNLFKIKKMGYKEKSIRLNYGKPRETISW